MTIHDANTDSTSPSPLNSIGFIGGGNMALALLGGLRERGYATQNAVVVEKSKQARDELLARFEIRALEVATSELAACDVVILAVKPQNMSAVTRSSAPFLKGAVISIAAGVRSADIARWAGPQASIIRCMPNTPALVGAGITGLFAHASVDALQRRLAESIMQAVGSTFWVEREEDLDAVTAISGSGPAYVFYWMEALQRAAEDQGLNSTLAAKLVAATFDGAFRLATHSDENIAELRRRVTSEGGTTHAAIGVFERSGVAATIGDAVTAARIRAATLGDEYGHD